MHVVESQALFRMAAISSSDCNSSRTQYSRTKWKNAINDTECIYCTVKLYNKYLTFIRPFVFHSVNLGFDSSSIKYRLDSLTQKDSKQCVSTLMISPFCGVFSVSQVRPNQGNQNQRSNHKLRKMHRVELVPQGNVVEWGEHEMNAEHFNQRSQQINVWSISYSQYDAPQQKSEQKGHWRTL